MKLYHSRSSISWIFCCPISPADCFYLIDFDSGACALFNRIDCYITADSSHTKQILEPRHHQSWSARSIVGVFGLDICSLQYYLDDFVCWLWDSKLIWTWTLSLHLMNLVLKKFFTYYICAEDLTTVQCLHKPVYFVRFCNCFNAVLLFEVLPFLIGTKILHKYVELFNTHIK